MTGLFLMFAVHEFASTGLERESATSFVMAKHVFVAPVGHWVASSGFCSKADGQDRAFVIVA